MTNLACSECGSENLTERAYTHAEVTDILKEVRNLDDWLGDTEMEVFEVQNQMDRICEKLGFNVSYPDK